VLDIFVSVQGGGRSRCGGIVGWRGGIIDWRQRGNDANSECLVYEELKNGVLVPKVVFMKRVLGIWGIKKRCTSS